MAESETTICNMSLARLGAKRINDYDDDTDTKPEAIYCRLFFPQTVKALLTDHYWPFAKGRESLSRDTTAPAFQHLYAYHLPNDFLRLVLFYNGSDKPDGRTYYPYEIEGQRLYTDETTVYLKYIKYVTDVGQWSALFIEAMVLLLASKLVVPLAQELNFKQDIVNDLNLVMPKIRSMDRMEESVIGTAALRTWNSARYSNTA